MEYLGILGLRKGKKQDVEVVKKNKTEDDKGRRHQGSKAVTYNEDLVF